MKEGLPKNLKDLPQDIKLERLGQKKIPFTESVYSSGNNDFNPIFDQDLAKRIELIKKKRQLRAQKNKSK